MQEDNLNPLGAIKTLWNNKHANFPFNNKGEVDTGGDGDGDDGGGGDDGGSGGGTVVADWRENLDPTIKDHPVLERFKTPADVAKSYVEIQKLVGKEKIPVPSKDADPLAEDGNSEWNMVYDRMGRPSDPNGYEIPKVDVPDGFPPIPEETIKGFKELSHKIGLLPHQVKALYQWQHEQAVSGLEQNTQVTAQALQKSEAELRKEYGKAFDANLSGAKGLIQKFGGPEVLSALESTGLGNNPHVIRMMVKIAKQFGEDGNIMAGETQSGVLSPQEAQAEVDKILSDKNGAYWNRPNDKGIKPFSDAEHKAMVKKVQDLMEMAHPGKA